MAELVALGRTRSRAEAHLSGAERGKGAVYAWDGNKNVGSGRMEILDSLESPSKIVIKLDFLKPFEATTPPSSPCCRRAMQPKSTWVMHGPAPFMSKLMQVFMNFDNMIGKDFEAGLAKLKTISEK